MCVLCVVPVVSASAAEAFLGAGVFLVAEACFTAAAGLGTATDCVAAGA